MPALHTPSLLPLQNRKQAGQLLGHALQHYAGRNDIIVLALPRGGVPVAFEVASALRAPLDLMLVRKLGTPGQEELAMGAITQGGVRVMNPDVVDVLRVSEDVIAAVERRERKELERRQRVYRGNRPPSDLRAKCVMLIDDGLATGATMRSAVQAVRAQKPSQIVIAVPIAPENTVDLLRDEADEVVCLATPEPFVAIGRWYLEFPQTSDAEVKALLERAWQVVKP
jgi:putative phosphoribosyl transferase